MRTTSARTRRAAALLLAAVAATGTLAACSSSENTTDSAATATVQGPQAGGSTAAAAAVEGVQKVGVDEFAAVVATPGVVVLDVRTPEEFTAGHLEGATNINLEGPDFVAQIDQLPRDTTYAVYCRSGNRSGVAAGQMGQMGFTSVADLDGGIVDWEAAGQPVVS